MNDHYRLPAEWERQSAVMLTWPHSETDWRDMLDEVEATFLAIAHAIRKREKLIVVCKNAGHVQDLFKAMDDDALHEVAYIQCDTNDTWARDHGFITITDEAGQVRFLDFRFNGWGMKFAANHDNQINRKLYESGILKGIYESHADFVLEGGSIESDGHGTILTTSECLLSRNRNEHLTRNEIEEQLKRRLRANRILWLDYGFLAGDDTDSHIDTLARLCPNDTIAYVQCDDQEDIHYDQLYKMRRQLEQMTTLDGKPYRLVPLPHPTAINFGGERLPATYANFLVINGAVLMPTYNQPLYDQKAAEQLSKAFPEHEIVSIPCLSLIKQHGSLHCSTMQFPEPSVEFKH